VRVHAGRGFVQHDDRRVADKGDRDGKLALVSARVCPSQPVLVLGEVHLADQGVHHGVNTVRADALDAREEVKVLTPGLW
jgi:hypothetical protein